MLRHNVHTRLTNFASKYISAILKSVIFFFFNLNLVSSTLIYLHKVEKGGGEGPLNSYY